MATPPTYFTELFPFDDVQRLTTVTPPTFLRHYFSFVIFSIEIVSAL